MKSNAGHTEYYFNLVRFFQGLKTEAEKFFRPPPKIHPITEAELTFDTSPTRRQWYLYNGISAKAMDYFALRSQGRVWLTWGLSAQKQN